MVQLHHFEIKFGSTIVSHQCFPKTKMYYAQGNLSLSTLKSFIRTNTKLLMQKKVPKIIFFSKMSICSKSKVESNSITFKMDDNAPLSVQIEQFLKI